MRALAGWIAMTMLALAASTTAYASGAVGTVSRVWQMGALIYVYVAPNAGQVTDTCGSGRSELLFTVDGTTSSGKNFVMLATTAKVTAAQVWIAGNGDCTTSGVPNGSTSETINNLALQ